MLAIVCVLVAVVVAAALFLLAAYLLPAGEQIAPVIRDDPVWALPADRQLGGEDVASVRLPVALRGYRFAETDLLLDRLADELKTRDAEIARLRDEAAYRGDSGRVSPFAAVPPPEMDAVADPVGRHEAEPRRSDSS